jgi:hypothetical protein
VGDAKLGEWREVGDKAVHLRRRLTDEERVLGGNLIVRDIRGTAEEQARFEALLRDAPYLAPVIGRL